MLWKESSRLQSSNFLSHDLSFLPFFLSDLKKTNAFFQRLVLLRTWLKALLINMEYDLQTFTTGIFHVSSIFYSLAILIWLDPATGPWRENRQLKRPWVPSYAPVLLNSKQKYLNLVWHHQLKTGLDQPPKGISCILQHLMALEDAAENKGGCPLPQGEQKKSWLWSKGYHRLLAFSENLVVEATGSFYLLGIWCHDEINNS